MSGPDYFFELYECDNRCLTYAAAHIRSTQPVTVLIIMLGGRHGGREGRLVAWAAEEAAAAASRPGGTHTHTHTHTPTRTCPASHVSFVTLEA